MERNKGKMEWRRCPEAIELNVSDIWENEWQVKDDWIERGEGSGR